VATGARRKDAALRELDEIGEEDALGDDGVCTTSPLGTDL
jgi:hypothetical protein